MSTTEINNTPSPSHAYKVLAISGAILITISLIAYSILLANHFLAFLPNLTTSQALLYSVPGTPGAIGLILESVALCLRYRRGENSSSTSTPSRSPTSEENAGIEASLEKAPSLFWHPEDSSLHFDEAPPLKKWNNPDDMLTIFYLLFGDYTGQDNPTNNVGTKLTLSFIIPHLKSIAESSQDTSQKEKLHPLIEHFETSYQIAHWFGKLQEAQNYRQACADLKTKLIALLQEKKSLMIPSGYVAKPSGHNIVLWLHLREDGMVSGDVVETGEGFDYGLETVCTNTGKKKTRGHLHLPPTPLESIAKTHFF